MNSSSARPRLKLRNGSPEQRVLGRVLLIPMLGLATAVACGGEDGYVEEFDDVEQSVTTTVLTSGFESPTTSSFLYEPVTGATLHEGSGVQGAQYDFGVFVPAPVGAQQAFLQAGGSIERTVELTGGSQTLTFSARRTTQLGGSLTTPLQIFVGNTAVGTVLPPNTASYAKYSIPLPGSGRRRVALVNPVGAAKTLIDEVILTADRRQPLWVEGFETPNAQGSFVYQPVSSDWLYVGAGVQRSAYVNDGWLTAPVGQQFGFLQSGASMRRVVSFSAGTHSLSMRVARSPQLGGSMSLPLEVYVGSTRVGSFTFSNTAFAMVTVPSFEVGAGRHVVRLVNAAGAAYTFVDEVVILR